jgi:hypothetical protein
MDISEFNKMQGTDQENLELKLLSDTCGDNCTCKTPIESSCVCGDEVCNC